MGVGMSKLPQQPFKICLFDTDLGIIAKPHYKNVNSSNNNNNGDSNCSKCFILNNNDWCSITMGGKICTELFFTQKGQIHSHEGHSIELLFEDDEQSDDRRMYAVQFDVVSFTSISNWIKTNTFWDCDENSVSENTYINCLNKNNIYNAWSKMDDGVPLSICRKLHHNNCVKEENKSIKTKFSKKINALTGRWFPLGKGTTWQTDGCAIARLRITDRYLSFDKLSALERQNDNMSEKSKARFHELRHKYESSHRLKKMILFTIESRNIDVADKWQTFLNSADGVKIQGWQQQWEMFWHVTEKEFVVWVEVPPKHRK